MPCGLVRSGDFRKGTPIQLPHNFGNPVNNPEPFGNNVPQSNPTLNSNPVLWTIAPNHFGNGVELSLQSNPPIIIIEAGGTGSISIPVTDLGNFVGTVTLSASGQPVGVTVSFAPNPATMQSTAEITVASTVRTGKYTITVTGQTATQSYNTNIHLVVVGNSLPSNAFGFLLEDGTGVILLEDGSILLLENQS